MTPDAPMNNTPDIDPDAQKYLDRLAELSDEEIEPEYIYTIDTLVRLYKKIGWWDTVLPDSK
jgi:hypothetical protein